MSELAELRLERGAEVLAMGGIERAVAQSMVSAFEGDDAGFTGG